MPIHSLNDDVSVDLTAARGRAALDDSEAGIEQSGHG